MRWSIINSTIYFSYSFNKPLSTVKIPEHIRIVEFKGEFNQDINSLPDYITKIYLRSNLYSHSITKLPANLKLLSTRSIFDNNNSITCFPPKLQYLYMNQYTSILPELPDTLRVLRLDAYYNMPLPKLPVSLVELCIGNSSPPWNMFRPFHTYPVDGYYIYFSCVFSGACKFSLLERTKINCHNRTKRQTGIFDDLL